MISSSDRERWTTWLVQAAHFASRENFADAVARARVVEDEVAAAASKETDATRLSQLERFLANVRGQVADLQSRYDQWNAAIAERRQRTIDQAAEEMAAPLPVGPDER